MQFRDVWARRPSDSLIGATAPAARRGEGKAGRRATVEGRGAGEVGVSVSISICNLFEDPLRRQRHWLTTRCAL